MIAESLTQARRGRDQALGPQKQYGIGPPIDWWRAERCNDGAALDSPGRLPRGNPGFRNTGWTFVRLDPGARVQRKLNLIELSPMSADGG
jgi:hypothetical protein